MTDADKIEALKALDEIRAAQDFLAGQYEALQIVLTSTLAAARDAGMPIHMRQTILANLDQWRCLAADPDAATPPAQLAGLDAALRVIRPALEPPKPPPTVQ